MSDLDLSKLAEPFDAADIEWRVSRAGLGGKGLYCMVLAYITARGVQARLDEVCGPENWRLEEPRMLDVNGKSAFACGLSIRPADVWVTKWDVAEPTNVEPAKGGWSGAMKRAGAQWGIGRYLYRLDETFAEVTEKPGEGSRKWNYATIKTDDGKKVYYWKTPSLPAWALPKEKEHQVSREQLEDLFRAWREKFCPDSKDPREQREGFSRLVVSVVGNVPVFDHTCWTTDAWDKCTTRIDKTTDPNGPDPDVPFAN